MDKYKIERKLGEGGFGKVYLARHKAEGSLYVIKKLDVTDLQNRKDAKKEIEFLSKMQHPNIIAYREWFQKDERKKKFIYIAMDYADGGDLEKKIQGRRGRPFREKQIVDWTIQICLALKHIHDRKILHRDIKSQNVFLMGNGMVKLGDFGIAKTLKNTMALARTQIGTPYYLSPEICKNKPYAAMSDMWSVGVVVYEATCLRHPFTANSMEALVRRICNNRYTPVPRTFSANLRNLIGRLLNKLPHKRLCVNDVLKKKWIQGQIKRFLSAGKVQEEFSHTVIHGKIRFPDPVKIGSKASSSDGGRGGGGSSGGGSGGSSRPERRAAQKKKPVEFGSKAAARRGAKRANADHLANYRDIYDKQRQARRREQEEARSAMARQREAMRREQEAELKRRRAAFAAKRKAEMIAAQRRGEARRVEAERRRARAVRQQQQQQQERAQRAAPRASGGGQQESEYEAMLREARIQAFKDRMKMKERMEARRRGEYDGMVAQYAAAAAAPAQPVSPSAYRPVEARQRRETAQERQRREWQESVSRAREHVGGVGRPVAAASVATEAATPPPSAEPRQPKPAAVRRESDRDRARREKEEALKRARIEAFEDRMRMKAKIEGREYVPRPSRPETSADVPDPAPLRRRESAQERQRREWQESEQRARDSARGRKPQRAQLQPERAAAENPGIVASYEAAAAGSSGGASPSDGAAAGPGPKRESAKERQQREWEDSMARARKEAFEDRMRLKAKMEAQRQQQQQQQRGAPESGSGLPDATAPGLARKESVRERQQRAREEAAREHEEKLRQARIEAFQDRMKMKARMEAKRNGTDPSASKAAQVAATEPTKSVLPAKPASNAGSVASNNPSPDDREAQLRQARIEAFQERMRLRERQQSYQSGSGSAVPESVPEPQQRNLQKQEQQQLAGGQNLKTAPEPSDSQRRKRLAFERRMKEKQRQRAQARQQQQSGGGAAGVDAEATVRAADATVRATADATVRRKEQPSVSSLDATIRISPLDATLPRSRGKRSDSKADAPTPDRKSQPKPEVDSGRRRAPVPAPEPQPAESGPVSGLQELRNYATRIQKRFPRVEVASDADFYSLQTSLVKFEVALGQLRTAARLLGKTRSELYALAVAGEAPAVKDSGEDIDRGMRIMDVCGPYLQQLDQFLAKPVRGEDAIASLADTMTAGVLCVAGVSALADKEGLSRVDAWAQVAPGSESDTPIKKKTGGQEEAQSPGGVPATVIKSKPSIAADETLTTPRTKRLRTAEELLKRLEDEIEDEGEDAAASSAVSGEEEAGASAGDGPSIVENTHPENQAADFIKMMSGFRNLVIAADTSDSDEEKTDEEDACAAPPESDDAPADAGSGQARLGTTPAAVSSDTFKSQDDEFVVHGETPTSQDQKSFSVPPSKGEKPPRMEKKDSLGTQVEVLRSYLESKLGTDKLMEVYTAMLSDRQESTTQSRHQLLMNLLSDDTQQYIESFEELLQLEDQLWIA